MRDPGGGARGVQGLPWVREAKIDGIRYGMGAWFGLLAVMALLVLLTGRASLVLPVGAVAGLAVAWGQAIEPAAVLARMRAHGGDAGVRALGAFGLFLAATGFTFSGGTPRVVLLGLAASLVMVLVYFGAGPEQPAE